MVSKRVKLVSHIAHVPMFAFQLVSGRYFAYFYRNDPVCDEHIIVLFSVYYRKIKIADNL